MNTRIICDIVPNSQTKRNSEGAFITLNDGRILFVYSRFGADSWSDGSACNLYGSVSHDNGEHFGEPFPILTHDQVQADNIMSVSLLRMANGDVGLFFLAKRDVDICQTHLIRSSDEGKTWSAPLLCMDKDGYYVVNNDRIIRTQTGRILIPAALHKMDCETINGKKKYTKFYPGELVVFASDDDGFHWYPLSDNIPIPQSRGLTTGIQEPGILQYKNGTLWCYIRTDAGRQYECFSQDDGKTWSIPLPSAFTSATSPMSTRYLQDGRIIAVWNPIPNYNGRSQNVGTVWTGGRTPLVIAYSEDDGQSFSEHEAIETDENRGFCYIAIHETDDGILLAYCAGGVEDCGCLNRLRIRKIYK